MAFDTDQTHQREVEEIFLRLRGSLHCRPPNPNLESGSYSEIVGTRQGCSFQMQDQVLNVVGRDPSPMPASIQRIRQETFALCAGGEDGRDLAVTWWYTTLITRGHAAVHFVRTELIVRPAWQMTRVALVTYAPEPGAAALLQPECWFSDVQGCFHVL